MAFCDIVRILECSKTNPLMLKNINKSHNTESHMEAKEKEREKKLPKTIFDFESQIALFVLIHLYNPTFKGIFSIKYCLTTLNMTKKTLKIYDQSKSYTN